MKKLLLLSLIIASIPYCAKAMSGDIAPASVMQVHDMQMIYEQKFRQEEMNDFNEVKEEKARYLKKFRIPERKAQEVKQQVEGQIQKQQQRVAAPSKRSEFIEENGKLKIKYY